MQVVFGRFVSTNTLTPTHLWEVDNSGSMNINDGARLIKTSKKIEVLRCTRWAEMQETVQYHTDMAALLKAPTIFRLLNDPGRAVGAQQFSVGEGDLSDATLTREVSVIKDLITKASPRGVTPLAARVREIRDNIIALKPILDKEGTRVALVLATDGLPTNSTGTCSTFTKDDFAESLRSLEGLPVWVVIRLCTDEIDVLDFYNNLDADLELSLEVIDDWFHESKEIFKVNKWINYGLALHRVREMGHHHRMFDLMDERTLTKDEVLEYFKFLFGESRIEALPDIHGDWKGFLQGAAAIMEREPKPWNPRTKKESAWVDLKKLNRKYGNGPCSIM